MQSHRHCIAPCPADAAGLLPGSLPCRAHRNGADREGGHAVGQGVQQALQGGSRGQVHILSRSRSCLKALLGAVTPCSSGQSELAGAVWRLFRLGKLSAQGTGWCPEDERWRGADCCRLLIVQTASTCAALHDTSCVSKLRGSLICAHARAAQSTPAIVASSCRCSRRQGNLTGAAFAARVSPAGASMMP